MAEPESDPPPADPEVREALDRMEEERQLPDAEDAFEPDEGAGADDELPVDDEADEGEEAPTG